jgi:hypothetical protein
MACENADQGALSIHDLSARGFFARGRIASVAGSGITGMLRIATPLGDRDVILLGTIIRIISEGDDQALGVRIDGFGSLDDERTFLNFLRELGAKT